MRPLVLLALAALAAFPLSARDHGRRPRRVVIIEAPRCAPHSRWEDRRWNDRWHDRWERRARHHRHDCDDREDRHEREDDRIMLRPLSRPLAPPFEGRMELRIR